MSDKRATCLNCMDGRVQLPVIHWIKKTFNVDFVDIITEAGMDAVLSNHTQNIKLILHSIEISQVRNKSSLIFIVGHHDCRGNPSSKTTHMKQIKSSVKRVKHFWPQVPVIGLWVNEKWKVNQII